MQRDADVALAIGSFGMPVLGLDIAEGFADRGYGPDGSLVPPGGPGALLDADSAVAQAVLLAGEVRSICIHGDSPGAAALAIRVRDELVAAGYELTPFA